MRGQANGARSLEPGSVPLYYQLEQDLRARIEAGEFAAGAMLPTEHQVCDHYSVSRITVRRALDSLIKQGMIERRHGVGSFVRDPRNGIDSRLTGSLNEFLASAKLMSTVWHSLDPLEAIEPVRDMFGLDVGVDAYRLTALGSLQGKPIASLEIWFPPDIGAGLNLEDGDASTPVIRIIERKFSLRVTRAEQFIEPDVAGDAAARQLQVKPSTPILRARRTYFAGSRPIEMAYVRYHPERYRYAIEFR